MNKYNFDHNWYDKYDKKQVSMYIRKIKNLNSIDFIDKIYKIIQEAKDNPNIILNYYFYYLTVDNISSAITMQFITYMFFNLCKLYPKSILSLFRVFPNYMMITELSHFMISLLIKDSKSNILKKDNITLLLYKKILIILSEQLNKDYLSLLKFNENKDINSKIVISDLLCIFSLYQEKDYHLFSTLKKHLSKRISKKNRPNIKKINYIIKLYNDIVNNEEYKIIYDNHIDEYCISSLCLKFFYRKFILDLKIIDFIDKSITKCVKKSDNIENINKNIVVEKKIDNIQLNNDIKSINLEKCRNTIFDTISNSINNSFNYAINYFINNYD